MAENSAIEWTDHTFNPWEGCQKVGPGCDHCYAEARNARFAGGIAPNWGPDAPRRLTSKSNWKKPLRWQAEAAAFLATHGRRQRVFCASLADVFDNAVSQQWRSALFDTIHRTPDLDWLLLTKRIGNVAKMTDVEWGTEDWPQNVWLGATIVNQEEADRDIPKLLATRGPRIRFLSMEPLLGPVTLDPCDLACIDWVIVGGESGPHARPMRATWARALRDQCAAAGVPLLFKQWGESRPYDPDRDDFTPNDPTGEYGGPGARSFQVSDDGEEPSAENIMIPVGKKAAGRLLDGVQHDGVPA